MQIVRRAPRPSPATTTAAASSLAVLLSLGLAACGHENDERAGDPTPVRTTRAGETTPTPTAWPEFAPADYTYRLEVLCFCPMSGPLKVTVADGEVASAVRLRPPRKGAQAPEFARLTINDIIAKANDPRASDTDVVWPDGADHPTKVSIDQIEHAVDDEVTYVIKDVRVTE